MASTDESSTDDDYDDGSISKNSLADIWGGNYVHLDINTIYSRFKIFDCIRQAQSEWKWSEISENTMGKGLHKVFKSILK